MLVERFPMGHIAVIAGVEPCKCGLQDCQGFAIQPILSMKSEAGIEPEERFKRFLNAGGALVLNHYKLIKTLSETSGIPANTVAERIQLVAMKAMVQLAESSDTTEEGSGR